jgi:hypothetical protein
MQIFTESSGARQRKKKQKKELSGNAFPNSPYTKLSSTIYLQKITAAISS